MTAEAIRIIREYIDAKVAYDVECAVLLHEGAHHEQDDSPSNTKRHRLEAAEQALEWLPACESHYHGLRIP